MTRAGRILVRTAIGVGVLLVLLVLAVTFSLNSNAVARRVIRLALSMPGPNTVHIAEVHGPLRGPLLLRGITYDANGMHAEVDSVLIRWKPTKLLLGRVELTQLAASGIRLVLPDSTPLDTTGTPRHRPSLPLPVILGDVSARDIDIAAPGEIGFHADSMLLGGRAQAYRFSMGGTLRSVQTGRVPVYLTGTGDLEHLELERGWAGLYDGSLVTSGRIGWWPTIVWNLAVRADSLRPELMNVAMRTWRGRVGASVTTQGTMDSTGLSGAARFDSLSGKLRGQPLSGKGGVQFARGHLGLSNIDLHWGSSSLAADGVIDDTVALGYDLIIGNLRTVTRSTGGTIHLQGAATGPANNARIRARLEGRNLVSGTNRIAALKGRADVELGPRGRNEAELRGSGAVLATGHFDSVNVVLRGSRPAHRLTARLRGATDTIRIAMKGGLLQQTWRGTLDTFAVRTRTLGGWRLEQRTGLSVSRYAGRVQPFCLAGDTVGERFCGQGDWRGLRNWNVIAALEGLPVDRLGPLTRSRFLQQGNRLAGTLGANLEAHAVNGLVNGNLRAGGDTVMLLYAGSHQAEQRLALDSAAINVISDPSGTRATLGFRVRDQHGKDRVTLTGRATLPPYRIGTPLGRQAIDVSVDGLVPDLSFLQPLLFGIDSLAGRVVLTATAKGTLAAPVVDARVAMEQFGVGLPGRRALGGNVNLEAHSSFTASRALQGEVRLTTQKLGYDYWYFDGIRRLNVDSAFVIVQLGDQGLIGDLDVGISDRGTGIGTLVADVALPQYHRLGDRLSIQPVSGQFDARIPDLRMLQPFVLRVDSLTGNLDLKLTASGRVNAPDVNGTLRLAGFGGRWPSGTRTHGDLNGDLKFAVLPDDRMNGSLRLVPQNATLTIPGGEKLRTARLDGTLVDLAADGNGVHGLTDLTLQDSTGTLVTLKGEVRMPGLTHAGESLAAQPIEGRLESRAPDLAFLAALTRQIDSAAGSAQAEATMRGTLNDSRTVGTFVVTDGALRLPSLGILLEKIQFDGKGDQKGEIAVRASMESAGGTLSISGTTPVLPSAGKPGRLEVRGDRFELMNTPFLHAIITPRLDVRLAMDSIDVHGEVNVPVARLQIAQAPQVAIKPSDDVFIVDSSAHPRPSRPFSGQVRLNLGDSVSFSAFNFDAQLAGSLLLQEKGSKYPTAIGTLRIEEGSYEAYGQDLTIRGGEVRYTGGPLDNPGLSITATRSAREGADTIVAGIRISGTAKSPNVNLFSTPAMSETQTLSYLLTGGPVTSGGVGGNLFDKALTSLGLRGGNLLAAAVGHQVGLKEATLSTANDVRGTALQIGRYLAPNLYVSYAIGVFDPISTLRLRYVLSNHITILAETGRVSGADVLIRKDAEKP